MNIVDWTKHPELIRGGNVAFCRMNDTLMNLYGSPLYGKPFLSRARCAAGIRIILVTDADEIVFALEFGDSSYADGIFTADVITADGMITVDGPGPHRIRLSGNKQTVTLHLPHRAQVRKVELALPDGVTAEALPPPAEKILFCGDSIMQGSGCSSPARALTALTAAALNADFHNTSVGSARMRPEAVRGTLEFGGTFIVVEFGSNDYRKTPLPEFEVNTRQVFATLAECGMPALFVAPIPVLGLTSSEEDLVYRRIIASTAAKFPQVGFEDGRRFFPADPALFAVDGVHPSDAGMRVYADALIEHIRARYHVPGAREGRN